MSEISAIITAKGYPDHIIETLSSIEHFASEIIVADIGLDLPLKERLSSLGFVKIVKIEQQVMYIEQIREQLKTHASHDYILFLDPDEILPEALKELLKKNLHSYDFFAIPRKNIIFGKWIEHSRWWPDYQVRLFKRDATTWPTAIHAQPQTTGKGMTIAHEEKYAIIHFNYESIDEYISKLLRYTKVEAQQRVADSKPFTLSQMFKLSLSEFVGRYFAAEGYKDGMHGFVLALLQMFYYILVFVYYWQEKKYAEPPTEDYAHEVQSFFQKGLYEINHWIIKTTIATKLNRAKLKIQQLIIKTFF